MSNDSTLYRGWHIYYDPMVIPLREFDWAYVHDDFDGAPDAHDSRCGRAASFDACKAEIDLFIEENAA